MAKLKFKKGGIEFELIGEPWEIESFVQRIFSSEAQIAPSQRRLTPKTVLTEPGPYPLSQSGFTKVGELKRELPTDRRVLRYVLSKPNFGHNLFEVQEEFFGARFKSRGETRHMYHKTARQLRRIRKKIETEEKGKFEEIFGEGGVKQFVFRRIVAVA